MEKTIQLFKVYMSKTAKEEASKILDSGYIGQGPKVNEFEEKLKDRFKTDYVLTTNSATSAEHLAIHLLKKPHKTVKSLGGVGFFDQQWEGINEGDEILATPLTCTASNWPILANNLKIKWVDVDPKTLNMDLDDLTRKITPSTKAIMVVHWGGYPNDLEKLKKIQQQAYENFGVKPAIIEDCAHSFGSKFNGQPIGSHGNLCTFSFQAIKHLTSVDGGALTLPHRNLYNRGKLLRWYGIDRENNKKDFRCLHPYTMVRFSDGTTEKISKIVKNKIDKDVLSYENGIFVPRKIKEWITSELGDRYFLKITTNKIKDKNISIITNDHEVLTKNRGWVRADGLFENEEILTSFNEPNEKQKELIIGSLLGDSSISVKKTKKKATKGVISETHSFFQKEYIELKIDALKNLIATTHKYDPNIDKRGVKSNGKLIYFTKSLPYFGDLRNEFYKNGVKGIPKDLIKKYFSKFMLAVWFMDDGRTQVSNSFNGLKYDCDLATNSFKKEDVEWLVGLLNSYGYECKIYNSEKKNFKNNGYRINFTRNGSEKLLNDISSYVPNTMRYKVGFKFNNYDNNLWNLGNPVGYFDNVIITKNIFNNYKTTYCLKVDSEYSNFQTSSIVVHNCEADISEWGYKFHMNDVNAVIGMENLKEVDENVIKIHKSNGKFYDENLTDVTGITLMERDPRMDSAFWIYSMLVDKKQNFMDYMKECGIVVSQVHERNDIHTCVRDYKTLLPSLNTITPKLISIPVGWWVTEEDREYIVDCIKKGW